MIEVGGDARPSLDEALTSLCERQAGRNAKPSQLVADQIDMLIYDDCEAESLGRRQIIGRSDCDEFTWRIHWRRRWRHTASDPPTRSTRHEAIEQVSQQRNSITARTMSVSSSPSTAAAAVSST
jgi:hypothetical protein